MYKNRSVLLFILIAQLLPSGSHILAANSDPNKSQAPQERDWVRKEPLGQSPKRMNDLFPLSDQDNAGNWTRYEAMWDEFEGKKLDGDKWWDRHQYWLGRQPSFFCPDNIEVSDGLLQITMKKSECPEMNAHKDKGYHTYTSACVQSKNKIKYGYIEIKAKPMDSAGSSSFWLQAVHSDWIREIDVFETGGKAKGQEYKYNMNLITSETGKWAEVKSAHQEWITPFRLADDYHVYAIEWNASVIIWYVDGVAVRRLREHEFHQPMWLKFDSETMPEWFGLPEDGDLPSTYKIQYVRAWRQEH